MTADRSNMRIVTIILLFTIQTGYLRASAIPTCVDSYRDYSQASKETDESDMFDPEETTLIKDDNNDLTNDKTENNPSISKEFSLNTDDATHKEIKRNTGSVGTNNPTYKPIPYPIIYKKIDPKLIITSQLYPINSRRVNNDKNEDVNSNVDETISIDLLDPNFNLTEITDDREDESLDEEAVKVNDTDVFNIRSLREHLLDHLLDYFLDIIRDEQSNSTRKSGGKNQMKIEDKLRNYYDPHHIDLFVDENEEMDYDESDLEEDTRRKNYKDKSNLEKQFGSYENDTDITTNEDKISDNTKLNDDFEDPTIFIDDSKEIVTKVEVFNHTLSTNPDDIYDDNNDDVDDKGSLDEEVIKSYTDLITTEASETVNIDTATGDTATVYQNYDENDTTVDQLNYYYDEDNEYEDNKGDDDENGDLRKKMHIQDSTEKSSESQDIPSVNKSNHSNINNDTNVEVNNDLDSLSNTNNSIQFVVHLQNVDSSQIDGKGPVNTTQILTILKKIKDNYKKGNSSVKNHKNKMKGRHCKKNILLNLNINLE